MTRPVPFIRYVEIKKQNNLNLGDLTYIGPSGSLEATAVVGSRAAALSFRLRHSVQIVDPAMRESPLLPLAPTGARRTWYPRPSLEPRATTYYFKGPPCGFFFLLNFITRLCLSKNSDSCYPLSNTPLLAVLRRISMAYPLYTSLLVIFSVNRAHYNHRPGC